MDVKLMMMMTSGSSKPNMQEFKKFPESYANQMTNLQTLFILSFELVVSDVYVGDCDDIVAVERLESSEQGDSVSVDRRFYVRLNIDVQ